MLKNKEDDFLGDNITNNIKYAENEWQAQGTVDRNSGYTKESLLHLLFEGFDYRKDLGDYSSYVARASTKAATLDDSSGAKNYVAAKLQHDLYLLDKLYYVSTSTSCNKNIFDTTTYIKKAIAVANPVYDDKSVVEKIPLIPDTVPDSLKVIDILKYLSPYWYTGQLSVSSNGEISLASDINSTATLDDVKAQLGNIIDRYNKGYTVEGLKRFDKGELNPFLPDILTDSITSILKMPLNKFLDALSKQTVTVNGESKNVKEIFLEDFTLNLHDPETIKMPFNRRGKVNQLEEETDVKTYLTRFLANSVSYAIYENKNAVAKVDLHYQEFLNDILEECLYTDSNVFPVYEGRSTNNVDIETSTDLAKRYLANQKYAKTYDSTHEAEQASLETVAKIIDNAAALIALYCPDVYAGYNSTNSPESSWGIHFLNEEDTENIFQNKDEAYALYNNVVIGYKLADALVSLRTCIGGFLFLENTTSATAVEDSIYTISKDIPINQREKSCFFSDFVSSSTTYYPAISMLNNIYKAAHGMEVSSPEADINSIYSYDFAPAIKRWLENECILFKGSVYGDYVEELNFLQDLTPDSSVHFNNVRAKKTDIVYKRFQDSKYEPLPFIEQTAPLLNNTKDNKKGIGVYGSDAFAGVGNLTGLDEKKSQNTLPPFIYDFDKGDQESEMATVVDSRVKSKESAKQRVHAKQGLIVAEDGLISPTIDELWTFLKYLTESDGSGTDKAINERLPQFYGVKKLALGDSFDEIAPKTGFVSNGKNSIVKNRLNPLHTTDDSEQVVDILNWKPIFIEEKELSYSSVAKPELQFGGYKITRYIEKIYDYEVHPFNRRADEEADGTEYEFNTEVSEDFNNVTGYLEKLYNQSILGFDLAQENPKGTTARSVYLKTDLLLANPLENPLDDSKVRIFSKKNDNKLKSSKSPSHATAERQKAFIDVARLLNYHKADGVNDFDEDGKETSYHNHFKKYLDHPKNLKEIERDLEAIRQNLQTLAEFTVTTYAPLGYADRARNRGTLHQLHKNAYEWLSTWLLEVNQTAREIQEDEVYHVNVKLRDLTDSLNDIDRVFKIVDADKKVTFEDGPYIDRYLHDWYDHFVLDLDSDVEKHISNKHPMYRANETLLSETYLAADGTWRSIHEHLILPIVYDEH